MANLKVAFGSFNFPRTLLPDGEPGTQTLATVARPRADGGRRGATIPRRDGLVLSVRGEIIGSTPDALEATLSAIRGACYGRRADLWFGRDDRYYKNAVCTQVGVSHSEGGRLYGVLADVSLAFDCSEFPNPFAAGAAVTPALTGAGGAITVLGNAPAAPVWTLLIGSGGAAEAKITLTNEATGETATLVPPVAGSGFADGSTVVLNRANYRVYYPTIAVESFGIFDGIIPSLDPGPGDNVISITTTGGVSVSTAGVFYTPRYR